MEMALVAEPFQHQYLPGPWRELPAAPDTPVHAAVTRALLLRGARHLPVRVELPNGRAVGSHDPADPVLRIHRDAFFHRVGRHGLIGFGESYMAGDWDADDLGAALRPFAARIELLVPPWMQRLRRFYVHRPPRDDDNTRAGARRNIQRHYDLSNDLFASFLDESMTYSCALFEPGDTLEQAQARKIDRILDCTRVAAGTRLLEIGTGWGALAVRAAERGARVTTVTLSDEQRIAARLRAARHGVADRVDVQLRDYRDVDGRYDAVVSVEMIEAVGERYWPTYFAALERLLAPGGRIGLQSIVFEHARMLATRSQYTWIHKYIFPGGAIPSVRALESTLATHTRLGVVDRFHFGLHYASTLREWRSRFDANADMVDAVGFDGTFRRMWDFYLAYCEAGFATGYLDDVQLVLEAR
ncbi:MAG TPA: cyclopropane-fatty-acyl-phospholipid synthase family protein [Acidimicrobiia bacterium]|nr:cyclopropane-fatty-acyl-phospholipid synthase family protein [Acidimicrobiia bacterium]